MEKVHKLNNSEYVELLRFIFVKKFVNLVSKRLLLILLHYMNSCVIITLSRQTDAWSCAVSLKGKIVSVQTMKIERL